MTASLEGPIMNIIYIRQKLLTICSSLSNWLGQNVSYFSCHSTETYGPAHDILVLIAYVQIPNLNSHTWVYSKARGLNYGLRFHPHPYFV